MFLNEIEADNTRSVQCTINEAGLPQYNKKKFFKGGIPPSCTGTIKFFKIGFFFFPFYFIYSG
eukprot:UN10898